MKRALGLLVAATLAAVMGLAAPQAAALAATVPAGYVVTPDGKIVKKMPPLTSSRKPGRDAGVFKGLPKTNAVTTLVSCDGVTGSACFNYNVGSQGSVSKNGATVISRIGGHTGALDPTTGYHTLGEMAVESADQKQIVEVGWTVDPAVNKTAGVGVYTPRMFVFSWVNGTAGVYNGADFIPIAGAPVIPGVTDLTPGNTTQMTIWHDDSQHVWWIGFSGQWIGYYPDSKWTGATPSVSFTRMQFVQLFGEIAATKSKPCSDMGLGVLPTDTVNSARFASTTYLNPDFTGDATTVNLYVRPSPATTAGSPYAGAIGAGSPPSTTNLRSFFYGGPMWNSAGTAAGTKGAC